MQCLSAVKECGREAAALWFSEERKAWSEVPSDPDSVTASHNEGRPQC